MDVPRQPFRFLDLPKEIRLMVYDNLPRTINHHNIKHLESEYSFDCILILRSVPVSILGTCKDIYKEASSIVTRIVNNFILSSRPKFVMAAWKFWCSVGLNDVLKGVQNAYRFLKHMDPPLLVLTRLDPHSYKFALQAAHQLVYGHRAYLHAVLQYPHSPSFVDDLKHGDTPVRHICHLNRTAMMLVHQYQCFGGWRLEPGYQHKADLNSINFVARGFGGDMPDTEPGENDGWCPPAGQDFLHQEVPRPLMDCIALDDRRNFESEWNIPQSPLLDTIGDPITKKEWQEEWLE